MHAEGTKRVKTEIYCREECEECGAPAMKRHAFLLEGARRNPASSAYGKDDCSWCSDDEAFVCGACPAPKRRGMKWVAEFSFGDRFGHMFFFWATIGEEISEPETSNG